MAVIEWTNKALDAACGVIHGGGFARGKRKYRAEMKLALNAALEAQGIVVIPENVIDEMVIAVGEELIERNGTK